MISRRMSAQGNRMRILVFGATGNVGSRVVAEALRRGHSVTGAVRNSRPSGPAIDGLVMQAADASKRDDVRRLVEGHDVVVSATRPAPGREAELVAATEGLLAGLRDHRLRLVLVGGAASLRVPGTDGLLAIDDPRFVAPEWHAIARACAEQFAVCEDEHVVAWTYISPPASLEDGERTGLYRSDTDELVIDGTGRSHISYDDFAVAIIDELEQPKHHQARFTVGY